MGKVAERINQVFEYLIDNAFEKNKTSIGVTLGYKSRQALWLAVQNANAYSKSLLLKIESSYPMINIEWVKTGEGEMVRGKENSIVQSEMPTDRFVKYLSAKNITITDAISRLEWPKWTYYRILRTGFSAEQIEKVCAVFTDLNEDWLTTGRGEMIVMTRESLFTLVIKLQKDVEALRVHLNKIEKKIENKAQ